MPLYVLSLSDPKRVWSCFQRASVNVPALDCDSFRQYVHCMLNSAFGDKRSADVIPDTPMCLGQALGLLLVDLSETFAGTKYDTEQTILATYACDERTLYLSASSASLSLDTLTDYLCRAHTMTDFYGIRVSISVQI